MQVNRISFAEFGAIYKTKVRHYKKMHLCNPPLKHNLSKTLDAVILEDV